jgi:uncharacterized membrane protein YraQ (UPF0718 family)
MIVLIVSLVLYGVAALLLWVAQRRRGKRAAAVALYRSWQELMRLVPRLAVGIIGAGFLARLLPQETVVDWLGADSGFGGLLLATIAGAITPGGPVVGCSLGAAALKAGAGLPQVLAYVTGWSLYALQRMLVWEVALMPGWLIRMRLLVSLPFPFVVGGVAMLISGGFR